MKKRALGILIALCVMAALLPFGASAAEIVDSGTCGYNVTWTLDSDGLLTISGEGAMYSYAFQNMTSVKTVLIEEGVTSIGEYAFDGCTGLTSVMIPSSVTSIGEYAFGNTGIHNDESNWENGVLYIGSALIEARDDIASCSIKAGTTVIADYAFSGCTSMSSVEIPDSVTSIERCAFSGCTGLTSVTIREGVTSIGNYAFQNCSSLTSVEIPDSVTSIGDFAFYGCTGLKSVEIPSSVTSIGGSAFSGCTGLTSVTIPEGVTSIGGSAFRGCTGLTSVEIPASVQNVYDNAFDLCANLREVFFGGSAEQFALVVASAGNAPLTGAEHVHFNVTSVADHYRDAVAPATCTEAGYTARVCDCGYEIDRVDTEPALGHDWTDWIVLRPKTAEQDGIEMRICKTDHIHVEYRVIRVSGLAIKGQPESRTVPAGTDAVFSVQAEGEGLTYRWCYRVPGGTNWYVSGMSGAQTDTITVPATEKRSGQCYRCEVRDAYGNMMVSDTAMLTVASKPAIRTQPNSVTANVGETVKFTVQAAGDGLTYQWQYKSPGTSTWYNSGMTGAKTATLTVSATAARNGQQYRCKVTNASGSVFSKAATLTVVSMPVIRTQPQSISAAYGDTVKFTVEAAGSNLTYQWQYLSPGTTTWKDSGMTGAKTAALTVEATKARNGQQYRCVVSNASGSVTSEAAKLTTAQNVMPRITAQPQSLTAKAGDTAEFSVAAIGGGLSYQWQFKAAGTSTWYNSGASGAKTPTLTVEATAARNGQQYRCVITNSLGSVTSDPAKLTVK